MNEFGAEGARALSEALKTNTKLTTLDMGSVQHEKQGKAKPKYDTNNTKQVTGSAKSQQCIERRIGGQYITCFAANTSVKQ